MSNILGIDQSYTSCGYCIVSADKQVLHLGKYTTDKSKDVYDRATELTTVIIELIKTHNVTVVNLEGLAFGMIGSATRDLAGLLFVLITQIRQQCPTVTCTIYTPTTVKKHATGSGKSKKVELYSALPSSVSQLIEEKKFKKTTGAYDICDAYWIATVAI